MLGPILVCGFHLPFSDAIHQQIIHHVCTCLTPYNPLCKDHTAQKERNRSQWFQKNRPRIHEKTPGKTHRIRATSAPWETGNKLRKGNVLITINYKIGWRSRETENTRAAPSVTHQPLSWKFSCLVPQISSLCKADFHLIWLNFVWCFILSMLHPVVWPFTNCPICSGEIGQGTAKGFLIEHENNELC